MAPDHFDDVVDGTWPLRRQLTHHTAMSGHGRLSYSSGVGNRSCPNEDGGARRALQISAAPDGILRDDKPVNFWRRVDI